MDSDSPVRMDPEALAAAVSRRWWGPGREGIERRVFGVFEGGGAKGVLYTGALEGMVDERCWFEAVVGASAGAITASLVAAGLRPAQVNEQMRQALATLQMPTARNGAFRVRDGASYLDQDALLAWLRGLLEDSFCQLAHTPGGAGATFDELYQLTGIELDVVAADLTRHQLVVFNYQLTPDCQVAEAVVASAAIPFVYESVWLEVPGRPNGMVVDGGIAANFPSFVFADRSFRRWASLPDLPANSVIVGFLLDESAATSQDSPSIYHESVFRPEVSASRDRRFRVVRITDRHRPSAIARFAAIVTWPIRMLLWPITQFIFNWFPRFLAWNGRRPLLALQIKPTWLVKLTDTKRRRSGDAGSTLPTASEQQQLTPKHTLTSRVARGFLPWFDRILIGIRPGLIFVGGLVVVTLGLGTAMYNYGWQPLVDQLDAAVHARVSIPGAVVATVILIGVMAAAIYAWVVLVVVFTAATFTHATTRVIGYDLAKTFLQGPGAPPWAGSHEDDHVIRLDVPRGITTLKVAVSDDDLNRARDDARKKTRSQIRAILATDTDHSARN